VPKAGLLTSDRSLAMLKEKAKAKEQAALEKERKKIEKATLSRRAKEKKELEKLKKKPGKTT